MEGIHTPRGHNCYLISGFLICDDDDDDYYYYYYHQHHHHHHHHHHHLTVATGNILKLHIVLLFLCQTKGQ